MGHNLSKDKNNLKIVLPPPLELPKIGIYDLGKKDVKAGKKKNEEPEGSKGQKNKHSILEYYHMKKALESQSKYPKGPKKSKVKYQRKKSAHQHHRRKKKKSKPMVVVRPEELHDDELGPSPSLEETFTEDVPGDIIEKEDRVCLNLKPERKMPNNAISCAEMTVRLKMREADDADNLPELPSESQVSAALSSPIFKEEFEFLNEKLKDLNRVTKTLRDSYRLIDGSLMDLQRETHEQSVQNVMKDNKFNMMICNEEVGKSFENTATCKLEDCGKELEAASLTSPSLEVVKIDSCFEFRRFLDPATREETFEQLFEQIDSLNRQLAKLMAFFDSNGAFRAEDYASSDYSISKREFDSCCQKTLMFLKIVPRLTKVYNHDLLEMFRIK